MRRQLVIPAERCRATIDAKYRSEASFLANEIIGNMWVNRANLASYATPATCPAAPSCTWITRVQTLLPQDAAVPANTAPLIDVAGAQVTVTVRWKRPGETTVSNHTAVAQINGS